MIMVVLTSSASGTCDAFFTLEGNRLTKSSTYLSSQVNFVYTQTQAHRSRDNMDEIMMFMT